jgi:indole-3-glycerol phosphate synthase
MTALVEVHTLEEMDRVLALQSAALVGINNRNLADFSVDLNTTCEILTKRMTEIREQGILVVSESGLHTPADLAQVQEAGAEAVLIGESLVKQPDPKAAIAALFQS